jgi:DNA gyrase inhibitor GyrI
MQFDAWLLSLIPLVISHSLPGGLYAAFINRRRQKRMPSTCAWVYID